MQEAEYHGFPNIESFFMHLVAGGKARREGWKKGFYIKFENGILHTSDGLVVHAIDCADVSKWFIVP